jgi:hypothetical protein
MHFETLKRHKIVNFLKDYFKLLVFCLISFMIRNRNRPIIILKNKFYTRFGLYFVFISFSLVFEVRTLVGEVMFCQYTAENILKNPVSNIKTKTILYFLI